jgi:maltose alpha-D-glucosyltransferase/alpha-amylase
MHLALAADKMSKAFQPEDFSLHYQRSLFSSMQALVREATGNLQKYMDQLQGEVRQDAETVLTRRQDILNEFKKIYAKKLDVEKIRIHGNYNTRQVLISGKDIAIKDFSGNPYRSYSEKRLKRSPLRDVATMIHSLYNVAYEGFLINKQLHQNEMESLRPLLLLWVHYMTSFFMKAYLDTVAGSPLIPKEKEEVVLMIHTYLLEKAVAEVNKELVNRPDWVRIPLRVIKAILK